uniref:Uncharacterized protein n=1 Tax=Tanacetum cinerariifolium TaxID=118510 RepID=A0A699H8R0_TANCI|nr:hypothetical protein [Tanacetum cinerariifolium]
MVVKDMVQHEPHFILEVVDNGFGSLVMWACVNLRSRRVFDSKRLIKRGKCARWSHVWLGLSTQPTPREDDRWERWKIGMDEVLMENLVVEKVKALGANGVMSGSRVRVVFIEVGGGVVSARVVSRVVLGLVLKVVLVMLRGWEAFVRWYWIGELSLEENSMKLVYGIFFGGFWLRS